MAQCLRQKPNPDFTAALLAVAGGAFLYEMAARSGIKLGGIDLPSFKELFASLAGRAPARVGATPQRPGSRAAPQRPTAPTRPADPQRPPSHGCAPDQIWDAVAGRCDSRLNWVVLTTGGRCLWNRITGRLQRDGQPLGSAPTRDAAARVGAGLAEPSGADCTTVVTSRDTEACDENGSLVQREWLRNPCTGQESFRWVLLEANAARCRPPECVPIEVGRDSPVCDENGSLVVHVREQDACTGQQTERWLLLEEASSQCGQPADPGPAVGCVSRLVVVGRDDPVCDENRSLVQHVYYEDTCDGSPSDGWDLVQENAAQCGAAAPAPAPGPAPAPPPGESPSDCLHDLGDGRAYYCSPASGEWEVWRLDSSGNLTTLLDSGSGGCTC